MILFVAVGAVLAFWLVYSWLKVQYEDETERNFNKSGLQRRLDEIENFLFELGKFENGTIGNILCLTSETSLTPNLVTQALLSVTEKHPLLRAKITTGDEGYKIPNYFRVRDAGQVEIPITHIDLKAGQWQKAWEEMHYQCRFEKNGLLWSATLLQEEFDSDTKTYQNSLIFFLHHSIADGISGVLFTKHFVHALNNGHEQDGSNPQDKGDEEVHRALDDSSLPALKTHAKEGVRVFPLTPSAHTLLYDKVGYSLWQKMLGLPRIFGVFFQFAIQAQAKLKPKNYLLEAFTSNSTQDHSSLVKQAIVTRELSEKETTLLVDVARNNATTVHGLLTAASHVVLCDVLRNQSPSISPPKTIDMISAVSIRKECSPELPDDSLGHYAVPVLTPLPFTEPGKDDILKLAKKYNSSIKKDIESGNHLLFHKVLESVGGATFMNITKSLSRPKKVINPEALTNLGRHYLSQSEHAFKISKLFFTVNQLPHDSVPTTMFCNEVVTFNGKLYWVTGYDHTLVERSQAEEYVVKIFERVKAIIA